MRRTHEWKHTDHITANTAPERLTLYSRTLVRPRWLALIRLASRSKDSRTILKGFAEQLSRMHVLTVHWLAGTLALLWQLN